jgi:predicted metal-dependent phosphoesterase TrpH
MMGGIALNRADLHTHTTASDGLYSPEELVRAAREAGLAAVAVTDHDTVAGVEQAMRAGEKWGIDVIPGVEISSLAEGKEIHVLGYFPEGKIDQEFVERLRSLREVRRKRNEMIVEKLRELGIPITMEEVMAKKRGQSPEANVGRPHIAEVLVDKGFASSIDDAFHRFLGKGGAAYCTPRRISPVEAIGWISEAEGVPVLAHPGIYEDDELVETLIQNGLAGLEVYHPDHDPEAERRYEALAVKHRLIMTGGSDFHGERHGIPYHGPLGSRTVEWNRLEALFALKRGK